MHADVTLSFEGKTGDITNQLKSIFIKNDDLPMDLITKVVHVVQVCFRILIV